MTTLSKEDVHSYLAGRHLIDPQFRADVEQLSGGVSCLVFGVVVEDGKRMVVKQALERLRVRDIWTATPERAIAEGDALNLAAGLTPGAVPTVLDRDRDAHTVTIEYAPASWVNWKVDLLAGDIDPRVAAWLGTVLATWHSGTLWDPAVEAQFNHIEAFEQLRLEPYHRTVAARHTELRGRIEDTVARLQTRRRCLVHGDFSPKNVLVGANGRWVLDFEVAHYGDPSFDVAFMLSHLILKAIHRVELGRLYELASRAFYDAYRATAAPEALEEVPALMRQIGCLVLSRVDGKSPVEYLDGAERVRAWELGRALLLEPVESLQSAWGRVLRKEES